MHPLSAELSDSPGDSQDSSPDTSKICWQCELANWIQGNPLPLPTHQRGALCIYICDLVEQPTGGRIGAA